MIISKDNFVGTVGGGSLEYKAVDQGREQLKNTSKIQHFQTIHMQ